MRPCRVYVTGSTLRMSTCTLVDQELLCGVGLIDVPASNIALSPDGKTAYTTFVRGPRFRLAAAKQQDVQNASALATAEIRGPRFLDLVHVCPIVSDYTIACGPPTGSNFEVPVGMAIGPDGKTAYVINLFGNETGSVTACEIQGLNLNCSQPTGIGSFLYPTSIALSPNGSIAYVMNAGNGSITACEVSGDVFENCQANDLNSNGAYSIALSPDGMTMYVSTKNSSLGGITICNVSGYMVGPCTSELNPDGVFNYPGSISLSKDGSQLFAAEAGNTFAYAASPLSGRVVSCLVDGETLLSCSNSTIIYAGRDVVGVAAY
jgi:DNA-binding beta-propeller fold protein YncE